MYICIWTPTYLLGTYSMYLVSWVWQATGVILLVKEVILSGDPLALQFRGVDSNGETMTAHAMSTTIQSMWLDSTGLCWNETLIKISPKGIRRHCA